MKYFQVWLFFWTALLSLPASTSANIPFRPGDEFHYKLNWSMITVGQAKLTFEMAAIEKDGPEYLHAVFAAQTVGAADKIFKVRDKIETWMDPKTGRPVFYKKKQREGKTKRDIELRFDWDKMVAHYTKNGEEKDPISVTENTFDPLSLLIAITQSNFTEGESKLLDTTDGKHLVHIEVTHEENEKIKTKAGSFKTMRLDVATKELEGVFEKSSDASINLWLNEEKPHIPLKLESEVVVGSFYGELVKAKYSDKTIGKE